MAERLTPYLRRRVLDLPIADRLALLAELHTSVRQTESPRQDTRLDFLADKMREVSGVDVRSRMDRTAAATWPRYLFIFIARREGYSQTTIGRAIGRDHSTICLAEKRVNEAFAMPGLYKKEINLYNKFVESL